MPYSFGEIVLVRFPFSNQTDYKKRPSVVVSSAFYNTARPDVVLMAITSKLQTALSENDITINQWSSAQLAKPSAVKPLFFTIEQRLIFRSLGRLDPEDAAALRDAIAKIIG